MKYLLAAYTTYTKSNELSSKLKLNLVQISNLSDFVKEQSDYILFILIALILPLRKELELYPELITMLSFYVLILYIYILWKVRNNENAFSTDRTNWIVLSEKANATMIMNKFKSEATFIFVRLILYFFLFFYSIVTFVRESVASGWDEQIGLSYQRKQTLL